MKRLFLSLVIGMLALSALDNSHSVSNRSLSWYASDAEPRLLETGEATKSHPTEMPAEIKVISYNIRWRSGEDLRKLLQLLKDDPEIGGASILGLQEVDRNKKRSKRENVAQVMARELGMHYAWTAPPSAKSGEEEETGTAILSSYPLSEVKQIVLPHQGPGGRRRVALGASVRIGNTKLRVYSVHSETRMSVDRKLEQMKAVVNDLRHQPKEIPAIILGDLNTWEVDAVEKTFNLFKTEGFHTPFDDGPTFNRQILFFPLRLKLDWIWLKHLKEKSYGVDRKIGLSDHWPLWIVLKLPTPHAADLERTKPAN